MIVLDDLRKIAESVLGRQYHVDWVLGNNFLLIDVRGIEIGKELCGRTTISREELEHSKVGGEAIIRLFFADLLNKMSPVVFGERHRN